MPIALAMALVAPAQATDEAEPELPYRHFASTSLLVLANLLPQAPSFWELNLGWRVDPTDVVMVEAITWRLSGPLGVPYGREWASSEHDYPGFIRDYGVGLAYQHFWWRGLFTTVHVTPFLHVYLDEDKEVLQNGFWLFLSGRVGWHFAFARQRLFFEPSVAFNAWPIETHQPASFAVVDDPWPNFFLLDPGLNLGLNF